jgi:acyl phosphate:glycerol-3-phosphate acyltransferase
MVNDWIIFVFNQEIPKFILVFILGYFAGSIPFGLLLTKIAGLGDIRQIGSGNIGATNVLRTGRKGLALATLLLDGAKAGLVVLVLRQFGHESAAVAGFGAMFGHCFPIWLKFKGGKGVATALGFYWALLWPVGLTACLTWLACALLFRISSLAALMAMGLAPFAAWLAGGGFYALITSLVGLLVYWRHASNIRRLLKGQEPRINFSKSRPPSPENP